jgi:hypothetical protein
MLPLIRRCSHGLVPIDSIDVQALTTAFLFVNRQTTARFRPGQQGSAFSFKSMRRALLRELVKKGLARQAGGELENFGRINS